ncbi:MAG: 4-hydroxy-tetrahydrodipicolinate reductase, partial [Cytophagales bacterium]
GYGKMGKTIEQIALKRGHEIVAKIDRENQNDIELLKSKGSEVVIEFTNPEAAFDNITTCLTQRIPTVSGSTGWLDKKPKAEEITRLNDTAFFYASNFSVGVNIFFKLNKFLAKIMSQFPDYEVKMEEIHHTQKLDSPSGTAITLAEGFMEEYPGVKKWVNEESSDKSTLGIVSKRIENVPGTHIMTYKNLIDTIEIRHEAHNREGFATGAVLAAEFIVGKKGVFGMDDMLSL